MGYRMAEEYRRPSQSRFIDLVGQSARDYARGKSESSGRVADLTYRAGADFGQGVGQGLSGLGAGIGRGLEGRAKNRLSEEQLEIQKADAAQRRATHAAEYGTPDDPLTFGADESTVGMAQQRLNASTAQAAASQKLQQDIFNQQKGMQDVARQDVVAKRAGEKKKREALASLGKAYSFQGMPEEDLMKMAGGPIDTAAYPQQAVQDAVDQLAAKGYTPEQINQYQLEARQADQQRRRMEGITRTQMPEYQQALPVFQRADVDLNAIEKLRDTLKTYKGLGAAHWEEEVAIGEDAMDDYQTIMKGLGAENMARGIEDTAVFQSKRDYMTKTVEKAISDRIDSMKSQIAALSPEARRQPEIRAIESKIAYMEQNKGRPSFTGKQPARAPAPYNPYVTASQHKPGAQFQKVGAQTHPFEGQ